MRHSPAAKPRAFGRSQDGGVVGGILSGRTLGGCVIAVVLAVGAVSMTAVGEAKAARGTATQEQAAALVFIDWYGQVDDRTVELVLVGVSTKAKPLLVKVDGTPLAAIPAKSCTYRQAKASKFKCTATYRAGALSFGEHTIEILVGKRVVTKSVTTSDVYDDEPKVTPTRFHLLYMHPSDRAPVAGRAEAIGHIAQVVDAWFAQQMSGLSPRFVADATGNPIVTVIPSTKDAATLSTYTGDLIDSRTWMAVGILEPDALPILFIDGMPAAPSCGHYTWGLGIEIPMDSCQIYPDAAARFPFGGTYLLAHEMTHALGGADRNAPHTDGGGHVTDDPRDIIFNGVGGRDWEHLALDPGHDDYYLTGRSDLMNIENSTLLERH
ncbi:MAG: hypothetical protein QG597_1962 [Actinomycetota bacterium]|nr:hypothetical protein [Actinomycetota bacterium]